jgi:hypothetical protein
MALRAWGALFADGVIVEAEQSSETNQRRLKPVRIGMTSFLRRGRAAKQDRVAAVIG